MALPTGLEQLIDTLSKSDPEGSDATQLGGGQLWMSNQCTRLFAPNGKHKLSLDQQNRTEIRDGVLGITENPFGSLSQYARARCSSLRVTTYPSTERVNSSSRSIICGVLTLGKCEDIRHRH
jgi:hypothetical protein